MDIIQFAIAFNLGLFSTVHCLGMCGGIIGALGMGVRYGAKEDLAGRIKYSIAYNSGRIFSYTVAGGIAGFAGQYTISTMMPESGHQILQFAAAIVLVLIGLHLAGWFPKISVIESAGIRVWRLIQPLGKRFMPVNNLKKAVFIGIIWGWMPCALVYSVLLWSLTSGESIAGMIIMFAFGLGTLPGMITAGVFSSSLADMLKNRLLRISAGVIIILFGIFSPFFHVIYHKSDQNHHHNHDKHYVTSLTRVFLYHHYPLISDVMVFPNRHTDLT